MHPSSQWYSCANVSQKRPLQQQHYQNPHLKKKPTDRRTHIHSRDTIIGNHYPHSVASASATHMPRMIILIQTMTVSGTMVCLLLHGARVWVGTCWLRHTMCIDNTIFHSSSNWIATQPQLSRSESALFAASQTLESNWVGFYWQPRAQANMCRLRKKASNDFSSQHIFHQSRASQLMYTDGK